MMAQYNVTGNEGAIWSGAKVVDRKCMLPTGMTGNPPLVMKGNKGKPERHFPLGLCEGNCRSDEQCEGDLVCFERKGFVAVPGCDGQGKKGRNYCVEEMEK